MKILPRWNISLFVYVNLKYLEYAELSRSPSYLPPSNQVVNIYMKGGKAKNLEAKKPKKHNKIYNFML